MSDARWGDPREYDARDPAYECPRVYDPRDRDEHDPRDGLMRDLDLPRGDERELVVDRQRVYELDGEDSRALAAVGAFRVVPEQDLDVPHDTLENLHDQRLVEASLPPVASWFACSGLGHDRAHDVRRHYRRLLDPSTPPAAYRARSRMYRLCGADRWRATFWDDGRWTVMPRKSQTYAEHD